MPPSAPDARSPFRALTDDGVLLCGEWIVPPDPVGVAVTLHAMMVNRRTMDRPAGGGLASALAARGLAVANVDFRGHGESAMEGAPTYDDFVVHDIPAVVAAARAPFPGLRVAIVGHSLGGHTTLLLAGLLPHRAPDALVMLASNLWLRRTEPSALRRAQKGAALAVWLAVARTFGSFDAPRFRFGSERASLALVEQFHTFFATDALRSRDGTIDYDAALGRAALPVLSISSEGDSLLAHPAAARAFAELAPRAHCTHRVIRHGELGGPAPDHMGLVTSPASRPVWDDVARWLVGLASTKA